ncbi:hypothetical protein SAY86_003586 [Trapa natans]|uniref:FHA domain-containing protein n=1 Tax=Trapa natans TaxID=22666 RepID=A0AAN7ME79_TRANT|nr:hypothetical protein SAY86_003586 [Trapa natans]
MAEAEMKIPVFTVLKNGAILKNIFIVSGPPTLDPDSEGRCEEEVLVVGRHPDCSIVLTHPSVSRFHLQIFSNPSSQKLSVVDLSSVHGTWVSDKKIEPGEKVQLTEGDILKVGVSSRVYKLHWVPLSQAYDLEQSFISSSDISLVKEAKDETAVLEGKAAEAYQEIEIKELGEFSDSSDKRGEEHSPFHRGEVMETAEDDHPLNVIDNNEEIKKIIDPLCQEDKENLMIATGEVLEDFQDDDLPNVLDYEEVEKITDSPCDQEKENLVITKEVLETYKDEGLLNIESEKSGMLEDPFSEEQEMGIYQERLTEVEETHSLDLILGEIGSLTFTEASELSVLPEISTAVTMSQDVSLSISLNGDEGWQGLLEIDMNQMENYTTCQVPGSDSVSLTLPMEDQFETDDLKCDDEQIISQQRWENELQSSLVSETSDVVESRWSSEKGEEGKESPTDFSASRGLLPALSSLEIAETRSPHRTAEENFMSQQQSSIRTPQNCEGVVQLKGTDVSSLYLVKPARKSSSSCLSEKNILSDISCRYITKENRPARSPLGKKKQSEKENLGSTPIKASEKSNSGSIWSRRGKPATPLQLQTGSNKGRSRSSAFNSEKGNHENKLPTRVLFAADSDGEEIFTPDKENMTPNTRKLKFLKEIGEVGSSSKVSFSPKNFPSKNIFESSDQENCTPMKNKTSTPKSLQPKFGKVSEACFSSDSYPSEDISHPSDKENQTPEFQREHKRVKSSSRSCSRLLVKDMSGAKGPERLPFQSLLVHSEVEYHSSQHGSLTSSSWQDLAGIMGRKDSAVISNNSAVERKKGWIMVADITSFLEKGSRKFLQLLQGLRGTQLVIPQTVLRELESMKRQRSFFRKPTDVCSVLEWIEDSMVNSKWWIHIQSSAEEGWAIAPTPRASPFSLNEADDNFPLFTNNSIHHGSVYGSPSNELVSSPTIEDRILEYALVVKKRAVNEQVVLLSNDVSLKIKAMAEGLLCETVQDFRESLIDPFSERFMWAESSPRGQTWSLRDDAFLKNKCFQHPFKKNPRGGDYAKGLKLILRHNSHYGQTFS